VSVLALDLALAVLKALPSRTAGAQLFSPGDISGSTTTTSAASERRRD
jgi:hypothetical protein